MFRIFYSTVFSSIFCIGFIAHLDGNVTFAAKGKVSLVHVQEPQIGGSVHRKADHPQYVEDELKHHNDGARSTADFMREGLTTAAEFIE